MFSISSNLPTSAFFSHGVEPTSGFSLPYPGWPSDISRIIGLKDRTHEEQVMESLKDQYCFLVIEAFVEQGVKTDKKKGADKCLENIISYLDDLQDTLRCCHLVFGKFCGGEKFHVVSDFKGKSLLDKSRVVKNELTEVRTKYYEKKKTIPQQYQKKVEWTTKYLVSLLGLLKNEVFILCMHVHHYSYFPKEGKKRRKISWDEQSRRKRSRVK